MSGGLGCGDHECFEYDATQSCVGELTAVLPPRRNPSCKNSPISAVYVGTGGRMVCCSIAGNKSRVMRQRGEFMSIGGDRKMLRELTNIRSAVERAAYSSSASKVPDTDTGC